jgi:hypothetical protein
VNAGGVKNASAPVRTGSTHTSVAGTIDDARQQPEDAWPQCGYTVTSRLGIPQKEALP